MKPRIICLEGPNGAGKSTVAAELARLLSPSALVAYPTVRPPWMGRCDLRERVAWYIGDMLRGGYSERIADEGGMRIVRDRGILSTLVYQAGEDDAAASRIVRWADPLVVPADITLVLRLPDDEREQRLAASPRGARAELGGAEERARIARLYEHHAATFPGAVMVDASGPLADVVARCCYHLGVQP